MTTDRSDSPRPPDSTTMIARSPEDVLALVPVVFGFEPSDSMVLLTSGGERPFHARADLPSLPRDVAEMARMLAEPARRHGAPWAVLVVYSGDSRLGEEALRTTARILAAGGTEVVEGLRTDGRRWFRVPPWHEDVPTGGPSLGVPYDLTAHRFSAQAVFDGRVVHGSRADLAASIAARPDEVARVVPELAALGPPAAALDEGPWAHELVRRHTEGGDRPSDPDVARLLRGMLDVRVRDAALSPLRRDAAGVHVAFWSDIVRRSPDPLVPAPSAVLAFAAWQAGDGALAWCAVDRCCEVAPGDSLAMLVAEVLSRAVPPQTWEGDPDWTLGTAAGMPPRRPG